MLWGLLLELKSLSSCLWIENAVRFEFESRTVQVDRSVRIQAKEKADEKGQGKAGAGLSTTSVDWGS